MEEAADLSQEGLQLFAFNQKSTDRFSEPKMLFDVPKIHATKSEYFSRFVRLRFKPFRDLREVFPVLLRLHGFSPLLSVTDFMVKYVVWF